MSIVLNQVASAEPGYFYSTMADGPVEGQGSGLSLQFNINGNVSLNTAMSVGNAWSIGTSASDQNPRPPFGNIRVGAFEADYNNYVGGDVNGALNPSRNFWSTSITTGAERLRTMLPIRPYTDDGFGTRLELFPSSVYQGDVSGILNIGINSNRASAFIEATRFPTNGTANWPGLHFRWPTSGNTFPSAEILLKPSGYLNVHFGWDDDARLNVQAIGPGFPTTVPDDQPATVALIPGAADATFRDLVYFSTLAGVAGVLRAASGQVSLASLSDHRQKINIQPLTNSLRLLDGLQPRTFRWTRDSATFRHQGFIAHELAEVLPEAVSGTKDAVNSAGEPEYQMMDAGYLVPVLVAAVQDMRAQIQSMRSRLSLQQGNTQ